MRFPHLLRFVSPVIGLTLAGCATIVSGGEDDVPVQTSPSGATVSSSTGTICISPCAVAGLRTVAIAITISKPGYVTQVVPIASKAVAGTEEANSQMPSLDYFGRIVDAKVGANFEHVPGAVNVTLQPKSPAPVPASR